MDCLMEEYFHQSDKEKQDGLPVAPFMDRSVGEITKRFIIDLILQRQSDEADRSNRIHQICSSSTF